MALIHSMFFSDSLKMCVSCEVILPQRRELPEKPEKFRTLWLLHGLSDDETIWQRRTSIERYAACRGLAVVMPCAHVSGYADMAHGGKYYTYIARELPAIMRSFFPLSEKREDNYIAGLSMGGAGAMKIGLANPEQYCAIGCLSAGAVNRNTAAEGTPRQIRRNEMLYGNRDIEGTEEDVFQNARNNVNLRKPLPRIYHSCGSEDFILPSAQKTRAFFEGPEGQAYDYTYEQHPGTHSWEYWDEHIQRFLDFLALEPDPEYRI